MEPLLLFVFVGGWGWWMLSTIFAVQALCKLAVCLILFFVLLCTIFAIFMSTNFTCKSYAGFSVSYLATTPPPLQKRKSAGLVRMGGNLWGFMHSFARPVRRVYNHQKDINH